ncbi:MAG: hypothetical protein F4045_01115 [Chloroflexi bacterium]|nr:hypothetical protein [Chloroflexota bacterium]
MRQKKRRLTREQDELRLSRLRMLARIIARSYLGLLAKEEAAGSRALAVHLYLDRRPFEKDGGHVR